MIFAQWENGLVRNSLSTAQRHLVPTGHSCKSAGAGLSSLIYEGPVLPPSLVAWTRLPSLRSRQNLQRGSERFVIWPRKGRILSLFGGWTLLESEGLRDQVISGWECPDADEPGRFGKTSCFGQNFEKSFVGGLPRKYS